MSDIETPQSGDRIQKIIAQAGIVSRRDAEELIREGKVTVNGKTAKLGDKATLGKDSIKVRGKLIHSTEQKAYYILYKPKNVIAMINEDEEGRPTLKEYTKRIPERVFTVGRMDFTGEGAILLTNDGEVAQKMQKANDIIRRFHVKVDRHPTPADIEKLARGGRMDGKSMHPYHVRLATAYNRNALIEISFEGMSSIDIRKFFENKGFFPERIACVGIGHINAEKIVPGTLKKIEGSSVEALFTQPELAKQQIEKLVAKKTHVKTSGDDDSEKLGLKDVAVEGKIRGKDDDSVRPAKRFGTGSVFKQARSDARPSREGGFAPRGEGRFARGDSRGPRGDARSARSEGGFSRAPRGEGRPARSEGGFSRSARGEGRPARSEGGFGSRPPRTEGAFGSRAPRGEGRPARSEGGFSGRGERAPRSFGSRDGESRGNSRSFSPRGGSEGSAGRSFAGRSDSRGPRISPNGEARAPRADARGPRSDSRGPRPEKREFGASRGGSRDASARPARSFGARSEGGKPSAARPSIRFKRT